MFREFGVRKRSRKRGSAEPIRCYNHHITMRLTYLEAEVLDRVFRVWDGDDDQMFLFISARDRRALKRVRRKVRLAAEADQLEVQRANLVKRIDKLKAKQRAATRAGVELSYWDRGALDSLEGRLACDDFLVSGVVREKVVDE